MINQKQNMTKEFDTDTIEIIDDYNSEQSIANLSHAVVESTGITLDSEINLFDIVNIQDRIIYLQAIYKDLGRHEDDIKANINCLKQIENEIPGISEFLEQEHGVIDYGRYPAQLLLDQYLLKDDLESPYGILVEPRIDRKKEYGGGTMHEHRDIYAKLYEQLREIGINLRISEVGGKSDLAKQLLKFKNKYGSKHKLSFAIIDAHGSKDSIFFGTDKNDTKQKLMLDDLTGSGTKRALDGLFFAEGATLILNSCSTGAKNGIAQIISNEFHGQVIAPNVDTAVGSMRVNQRSDGSLIFHVVYAYGNGEEDEDAYSSFSGGVGEWGEIEL